MATASARSLSRAEVALHCTEKDCWVILHEKVYDVTSFLQDHPGGKAVIFQFAGKDGTEEFAMVHPRDIIEKMNLGHLQVGIIDKNDKAPTMSAATTTHSLPQASLSVNSSFPPPIDHCLNVFDLEAIASRKMKKEGWDYYSSGADDEITLRENHLAFQRLWLRPRVLVDVSKVTTTTTFLGSPVSMPIYITATALGKLAHPDGEMAIARAASNKGVIYMLPTLASCSFDEMISAGKEREMRGEQAERKTVQWMQLYVNKDRALTEKIVKNAETRGINSLFITVDAPQLGRREKDMRNKCASNPAQMQQSNPNSESNSNTGGPVKGMHIQKYIMSVCSAVRYHFYLFF